MLKHLLIKQFAFLLLFCAVIISTSLVYAQSNSESKVRNVTVQVVPHLKLQEIHNVNSTTFERFRSFGGMLILIFIAWLFSNNKRKVNLRLVGWGLGLQLIFALFILKTEPGRMLFSSLNDIVVSFLSFAVDGARFLFGNLVNSNVPVGAAVLEGGAALNGPITTTTPHLYAATGALFAFNVLSIIVFFAAFTSMLYHLRILQRIVRVTAWVMEKTMKTSGAETLSAAANIFVGMTEAPLLIKPYVSKMTNSELMSVMVGGMATVAGSVMGAYVGMLSGVFPDIAGHLMSASVMSAPAALAIAKIMYPETEIPVTAGRSFKSEPSNNVNFIDALATGASDGMKLALNVGAMLIAFIGMISMMNAIVGWLGGLGGVEGLTFQGILGYIFWPVAWITGIPAKECFIAGQLLGEKTVLNEFVAYLHLKDILLAAHSQLSARSAVILTYALCGFANFGSIAIIIGGIGGMAPERRSDLARMGFKALIGGTLAALLTGTIAGMLL